MLNRREMLRLGCGIGVSALFARSGYGQSPSNGSSAKPLDDPLAYVNPEFRPPLERFAKMPPPEQKMTMEAVKKIRAMERHFARPVLSTPAIQERMIPGPPGAPEVPIYIVGASRGASKPAVLHMHGGGYIAGSAWAERRNMQDLSIAHDCIAITVEYRLAPETPFPGSLEDNYAALRWLYKNAEELGVDKRRIAIKGESAGGGHAAALAIATRDRGEFPICFQVLIYPMLDDRTGSTRRVPPYIGHFIWTERQNRYGWSSLLGVPAGSSKVPQNSVPARIHNVAGLPPAFVGVGSVDLFCLEDMEYCSRFISAGIATELYVVPGAYHGFDIFAPTTPLAIQFSQAWNNALKRAFTSA